MEREKRRILDTCKRRIENADTRITYTVMWLSRAVSGHISIHHHHLALVELPYAGVMRVRSWEMMVGQKKTRESNNNSNKKGRKYILILYTCPSAMHNKDGSIVYIYPEQPKNIYTSNMFCAVTSHQPVRMFLDRYTLIIFSNSSLGQDLLYKKYIYL